ncbi:MAG TPA: transglycosylase SLT domain-containing protein [Myxococcota bacterium]|nr:transglycosylase SLT domain-containing protein [Myxococcota bacterium]
MNTKHAAWVVILAVSVPLCPVQAEAGNASTAHRDPLMELAHVSALRRLGFRDAAADALKASTVFRSKKNGRISALVDAAAAGLPGLSAGSAGDCGVLPDLPELAAHVMYERGRELANSGSGVNCLRLFLDRFPDHVDASEARLVVARFLLQEGRNREAAELAAMVRTGSAGRGLKAMAWLLAAGTLSEPGRTSTLTDLFVAMPDTVAASSAGISEDSLDNDALRRRAANFFDAFDFVNYQAALRKLWQRGDRSPELACKIARSHIVHVRDDPEEALRMMLFARERGVCVDPEGTFLLGRIHAKLEDYGAAEKCFREYLATGAKVKRMLSSYYLAWLPYDHGEYERALPLMDRFLKEYRSSGRYSYMIWFKGWSLFRLKQYREAISVFESMKKLGNNLVAGKAMYWGGVALHRLGDHKGARVWMNEVISRYPLTWYSVLAAKRLKQWYRTPLPGWMTAPAALAGDYEPMFDSPRIGRLASEAAKVSAGLFAAGRPAEAWRVWRPHADAAEKRLAGRDRARFMLTMADVTEQYSRLFKASGKVFGGRLGRTPSRDTGLFWAARYPKAYRLLVGAASRQTGIPELWVYSIMRQESRYDPGQVSHTAALGVMQMIAATARIVGRRVGVEWEVDTFFEPGRNILFGTRYLADLLSDFKGQIVFASAAYNSGAPAIRRFMKANRGLELDEMVEMIPYNEGRNYCRKVAEHLVRYGAIYIEPGPRAKLYDSIFPDTVDYDLGGTVDY